MFCILLLFVSLVVCEVNSQNKLVLNYFESASVRKFRKEWDIHRRPIENAIALALKETVGFGGMNLYIREVQEKFANGYFHSDNQVRLILGDLKYEHTPFLMMPEVQFSLSSNVLKLQATLSKIIVHSDYALIRNQSNIVYDPIDQDPFKSSPFLFQQVQGTGRLAIIIDDCFLSGFIITTLSGESVNLGYENFNLLKCQYTIEIYRSGEGTPPVVAKYNPFRKNQDLCISKLLLMPINNDLVPKLQAAMFSFINTSAIFGSHLQEFRQNQQKIFQETSLYITEIVRYLNLITKEKNHGAIEMEDYFIRWDDGGVKANVNNETGEQITLKYMVLTGLDTLYSAHSGGPFKLNSAILGEEIRFSTLQVRGTFYLSSDSSSGHGFAVEIKDLAVDVQLNIFADQSQEANKTPIRKIEVKGFREFTCTVTNVIFGSAKAMIEGHMQNEVPKLIHSQLKITLPEALKKYREKPVSEASVPNNYVSDSDDSSLSLSCNNKDSLPISSTEISSSSDSSEFYEDRLFPQKSNPFQKSKKRFKSLSKRKRSQRKFKPRKQRSGKLRRGADNQIVKK